MNFLLCLVVLSRHVSHCADKETTCLGMLCELHVNFISKHLVKTCCEQKNIVKFIIFSVHIDA